MFKRLVKLSKSNSFFLFGARGTGKTTLLKEHFSTEKTLWIDLLIGQLLDELTDKPDLLLSMIEARPSITQVVIDEVQRAPRLLDVVHQLSGSHPQIQFILTGSSARKLKRNSANMLAGRAFKYVCHPLTVSELGEKFNLAEVLQYGSLPHLFSLNLDDKRDYLRAYVETYFKEEIVAEQIVRNLRPFKNFLHVAAQMNGRPLNISNISKDVGIDHSTVQNYFEVLEDTLVGFLLEPYHFSVRKRQRQASKFYYFDLGVCQALRRLIDVPMNPGSVEYGNAFEHFCILEIKRKIDYERPDWTLSYLQTKDDSEIDLIIERPGRKTALIEFKSTSETRLLNQSKINSYKKLTADIANSEAYLFSCDSIEKKDGHVLFLPWWKMIDVLFNSNE